MLVGKRDLEAEDSRVFILYLASRKMSSEQWKRERVQTGCKDPGRGQGNLPVK